MLKQMKKTAFNVIAILSTIVCMIIFSMFAIKFSTIFYILIGGTVSVIVYLISFIKKKENKLIEKTEENKEEK